MIKRLSVVGEHEVETPAASARALREPIEAFVSHVATTPVRRPRTRRLRDWTRLPDLADHRL